MKQVRSYRIPVYPKSTLRSVETTEGETIEKKVRRIVDNKEPIKDGAPEIFTERKDGVIAAYNIRTDRWEIATSAMDLVNKNRIAKSNGIQPEDKKKESNQKTDSQIGEAESTQGQRES